MTSESAPNTWIFLCPDGNQYHVGDIIPVHRAAEGMIFGELVVRVMCPGFAGLRMRNSPSGEGHSLEDGIENGCCTRIPSIEGDEDCYFVGPESQAWRWEYARKEVMQKRAFQLFDHSKMLETLDMLEGDED